MKKIKHKVKLMIYLSLVSALCLGLSLTRLAYTNEYQHLFLPWNLFLAWLPLLFAYLATRSRWFFGLLWGGLWLLFLPNAPYIVTDLIHITQSTQVIWFDLLMIFTYALTGLLVGFVSLYWMQKRVVVWLGRVYSPFTASAGGWLFASSVLGLSGLGIYIGRFLRWNSWDIFFHPYAVLQSVARLLLLPGGRWHSWGYTLLLSALLAMIYHMLVWLPRMVTEE